MATDRAELVARIFYDTMYPSKDDWEALPKDGHTRTVLMRAANKALAALVPDKPDMLADQQTSDWPVTYKDQFWAKYPHKVGRGAALKILERLHAKPGRPTWTALMDGLHRYMVSKPVDRSWLNPSTFLTQERWADQPADIASGGTNGAVRNGSQAGFANGQGGRGGFGSYALQRARIASEEGH